MINIQEKKDKILSFLESNGPSLPVRIAKTIEMDPMFASAIASELIDSKQIKTSNMKIGASPLYLIPGQERQLENFSNNLKSMEKAAYEKLKERKTLIDEEEEPAIRVALRNIKDFASPFKFQEKIMWKYAFTPQEEIQKLLTQPKEEKIIEPLEEEPKEKNEGVSVPELSKNSEHVEPYKEPKAEEEVPKAWEAKKREIKQIREESIKEEKKIENIFSADEEEPEPEFLCDVKKFLKKKEIEFLEEIRTEKKEVMAIVKINSQLGDINLLLIAKDKKTTNKDEIKATIKMATKNNMSCLLIIKKNPSKPIQKIIDENHLVKLEIMD